MSKKILVLPDVQAKHGNDFTYLKRIGTYMLEKKPEIVVCIGDFADLESLSSYDKGKKSFEGRRYKRDVEASKEAMRAFLEPMNDYNERARRFKEKLYRPRMVMTLGNHEHRISRATEDSPQFDGLLSVDALEYKEFGWEVYPFLQVVVIDGIAFSHYFGTGVMGRPASTAAAQLRVANMSCFAGHQQGKQIHYGKRADGSIITSIISGSCYEHEESYLGAQGNSHWRGFWMLNDINNGAFDEMPVSLSYINKKYPHVTFDPNRLETITKRFQ
ncbi:MAG: metallophosphoesterase [Pseudomonadota bacterium]